jgi:hypothetical protein
MAKYGSSLEARIIPVRQEQLKERLVDRFRELDTPLLVEWPDGRRKAILFVVEEESITSEFSIYRLVRYCLDLAELMKTDRVVPVVIFLRPGAHRSNMILGAYACTYLKFRYLVCNLCTPPAKRYYESSNIFCAIEFTQHGLFPGGSAGDVLGGADGVENSPEKQRKYSDFIDFCADFSEEEVVCFRMRYFSEKGENFMGIDAESIR